MFMVLKVSIILYSILLFVLLAAWGTDHVFVFSHKVVRKCALT